MDITPLVPIDKKNITGYGNGSFKINNDIYNGNIVILPNLVKDWNNIQEESPKIEDILPILVEQKIEIILFGLGNRHLMLDPKIKNLLSNKHITSESMTTPAACRTYNVLLTEGRNVAAALLAI